MKTPAAALFSSVYNYHDTVNTAVSFSKIQAPETMSH